MSISDAGSYQPSPNPSNHPHPADIRSQRQRVCRQLPAIPTPPSGNALCGPGEFPMLPKGRTFVSNIWGRPIARFWRHPPWLENGSTRARC